MIPSFTFVALLALTAVVATSAATSTEGIAAVVHLQARKCISECNLDELQILRDAIQRVQESGEFYKLAHDPMSAHGNKQFLPWQRRFLHRMEHLLNVPMPYWDYADESIPDAYALSSYLSSKGKRRNNPLFSGFTNSLAITELGLKESDTLNAPQKPLGKSMHPELDGVDLQEKQSEDIEKKTKRKPVTPFPTQQLFELEAYAIHADDFVTFSIRLEQLQDTVLGMVGGDMLRHKTAPLDPLYWSILANTDRIFYRWQLRHQLVEPPQSVLMQDSSGVFSMSSQIESTSGWDRAFDADDNDANGKSNAGSTSHNPLNNIKSGTHSSVALQFGSAFGHIGDLSIRGQNVNRSHFVEQKLSGIQNGNRSSHAAVTGLGFSSSSARGSKTVEDGPSNALEGITLRAGTNLEEPTGNLGIGEKGSFSGANHDPIPETQINSTKNGINSQGRPGPKTNMDFDMSNGKVTISGHSPGVDIEEHDQVLPGTPVFVGAHNVSHFSNITIGDLRDPNHEPPVAQSSVAISIASSWGTPASKGLKGGSPPPVKTLGGSTWIDGKKKRKRGNNQSTAAFSKGIQQWGSVGRPSRPPKVQVIKPTPEPTNTDKESAKMRAKMEARAEFEAQYRLRSEMIVTPPFQHTILKICDVPATVSPFRVDVVIDDKYIIGAIVFIGDEAGSSPSLDNAFQPRDLSLDITRAHKKLLGGEALNLASSHISFRVTNLATNKRVRTPNFTVRIEPSFY